MKKLFSEIPTIKGERVTLAPMTLNDADSLRELTEDEEVYRYLPTFLYEKQHDAEYVIRHLYDECIENALILGMYVDGEWCGLAEIYGYRPALHKVSVGNRLLRRWWGKGISTEALGLMAKYLLEETDVQIITASMMAQNKASANVMRKNGFKHLGYTLLEKWGYAKPIITEKWVRTKVGYHIDYRFRQ